MGKIKLHEIAKELNLTSKEVVEKAKELGMAVKSHLSGVSEEEAEKVRKAFSSNEKNKEKKEIKKEETKTNTKKSKEEPVIIRREVIITDEEIAKREAEEKKKREKEKAKERSVGFVENQRKKDYNIVYREKPTKPLTVSELFGLKTEKAEKKEEKVVEEKVKERPVIEEKKEESVITEKKEVTAEKPKEEKVPTKAHENRNRDNNQYNHSNNYRNNNHYPNRQNGQNGNGSNYNNRYSNQNNQNNHYQNNNYNHNGNNNRYRNDNQNQNNNRYNNNRPGNNRPGNNNNRFGNNNRPLDEKGIEKNIKNIMSTEMPEKETVREYARSVEKQKTNRYDDKNKKQNRTKRTGQTEFNDDKLKSLKQEDSLTSMFNEGKMLDYYDLTTTRGKRNKRRNPKQAGERTKQKIFKLTDITIPETVSVKDFAAEMKKTSGEVIKKLLGYGVMATINNQIDFDTAFLVAEEFGIVAHKKEIIKDEDILFDDSEDRDEDLVRRPPVIVVMGHVDHGKTSLLDAIRSTHVIEGEAGGITQHIGAYKVEINGKPITFLDTPGHEAFTAMRARGAQITDIAILVVAANDGVMPQTIEAINHAKAAEIPIIVALNKMDVEGANPEKVKQELTEYGLVPEEWGGDTIFVPISAKKHENIDTLLEMVTLVAEMQDLKVNVHKQAKGVVIEAKLDKKRGPVASVLVQRGTLDVGDTILVGSVIGRVRAMTNDKGQNVTKAGPSTPVEIIGLPEVPQASETFYEVKDEKTAKHLMERRKRQEREKALNASSKVTLDDLFSQIEKGNLKQLNLIVKADVQGSVEAVKQALEKLSNDEVKVKVIHANVGGVTESDVTLAKVSNAIIIAFNVRPEPIAKQVAEKEEVEIKTYSVIYHAIEDVEAAMKGMLDPVYQEKVIGNAEVRQTFKVSNVGTIAGCYVTDGIVARNAIVRVIRDNVVIHEGKLVSLKRFKDDAKEVKTGYECGIQIEDFNDIQEGDIIENYIMEEVK